VRPRRYIEKGSKKATHKVESKIQIIIYTEKEGRVKGAKARINGALGKIKGRRRLV